MNEYLAIERETANETYEFLQWQASRCTSISPDRCRYCNSRDDDGPSAGWCIICWHDAAPGDIVWDSELWQACRDCNWDWGNGLPLHTPEGALVLEGCTISAVGAAIIAAMNIEERERETT